MSPLLDAYIDGELDPAPAAQAEAHIGACSRCAAAVRERRGLRDMLRQPGLYRGAPPEVRQAVTEAMPSAATPQRAAPPRWAWAALAACVLLAGAVTWLLLPGPRASPQDAAVREAVSSHIRSLMASHLADIAVSDQHAVKPWFAGKLDFSPRVVDHAADGFPLTGGRLDYLEGRPVAALVYQRRAHVINLFTCPDDARKPRKASATEDRGYNAITWSDGAMQFCAVSDLGRDELIQFAGLVGTRPQETPASNPP